MPAPLPSNPLAVRGDVLTFSADRAGIVTFTTAALAAAGWDVTQLDPDHIHAWRDGRQVPLELARSGGQLQALRLAVAPSASRWSDTTTYWLSIEDRPGRRATVPSATQGWTFDSDLVYLSGWPTLRGDRWWSAELTAGVTRPLMFDLPAAAPAGSALALGVRTTGAGGQLQLVLDGQALGAPVLGNAQALTLTLTLREALVAGRHTLTLRNSAPDPVLLDQLALPGLAVPLPELPTPRLQAHTPATPLGSGDTVIITPASLRPALPELVAAHQALGERVQAVDAQIAYDLYAWGERSPEAIRDYIRFAVARWTPAPQRVLLLGAGTVALRGAPPTGRETLIPPYLIDTDPRGEVSCDSCYGRTQTANPRDQLVPNLAVGRLPARTLAEAEVLVAKTVTALLAPPAGPWRTRTLLLADNDREVDGTPDPAGSFVATSEAVAAALSGYGLSRLYYAPGQSDAVFEGDVGRLRCRLFRVLDGGAPTDDACPLNPAAFEPGAALWFYTGHGSPWQWATTSLSAPTPYLFYLYDADARVNGARLPMLVTLTCLSGDWANPVLETVEERLLRQVSGGTLASLGSAGRGVNDGHAVFGATVAGALAEGRDLGSAQLAGLEAVTAGGAHRDLAYAFSILGDPSVRLPWRPLHRLWLPQVPSALHARQESAVGADAQVDPGHGRVRVELERAAGPGGEGRVGPREVVVGGAVVALLVRRRPVARRHIARQDHQAVVQPRLAQGEKVAPQRAAALDDLVVGRAHCSIGTCGKQHHPHAGQRLVGGAHPIAGAVLPGHTPQGDVWSGCVRGRDSASEQQQQYSNQPIPPAFPSVRHCGSFAWTREGGESIAYFGTCVVHFVFVPRIWRPSVSAGRH